MHLFSGAHHAQHKVVNIFLCCCLLVLFFAIPRLAFASSQSQLEGELEVLHWDNRDHTSVTKRFLRTSDGKRYELKFQGHALQHLLTGTKLRAKGTLSGNTLALTSGSTSTQVLASAPAPNTLGAQKIAVLLVNFASSPVQPFTPTSVNNMVFGTTNSFYQENSFQQTSLTGNVFGWLTLSIAPTCTMSDISSAAKQAAAATGVDLTNYSRIVYIFPQNGNCPWSGMASIGGSPSEAWINGKLSLQVIGHELGHNFGLFHSHELYCGSVTLGSSCQVDEYGDPSDIMANTSATHFNAFQKEQLGWLNSGVMPPITTVSTDGTYALDPYETSGTNPKALKILKSVDPTTGAKTWYYIEYRQALGFDAVLPTLSNSNLTMGVQVRLGTDAGTNGSSMLDMNPTGPTIDAYNDSALLVGQSYTDSTAGLTITPAWANGTSAGVSVSFAAKSCVGAKPSVVLSPTQGSSVVAGSPVTYTVAVTNNDNSACSASTFNLTSSVPAGWSASLGSSALTISPGSAASTTFTVTSPSTALAGSYNVGVTATSSTNATYSATGLATYTVGSATTVSFTTSVSTNKASYTKGNTVAITGLVTSGGMPVANASVTFSVTKPNGAVVTKTATTGSNGQSVYSLKVMQKDPTGTYQVRDTASSGGSSASASTSFVVQ